MVTARIENYGDLVLAEDGLLPAAQVRSVDVDDATLGKSLWNCWIPSSIRQGSG